MSHCHVSFFSKKIFAQNKRRFLCQPVTYQHRGHERLRREGGRGGGLGKVPELISNVQNFLDIEGMTTEFCDFSQMQTIIYSF